VCSNVLKPKLKITSNGNLMADGMRDAAYVLGGAGVSGGGESMGCDGGTALGLIALRACFLISVLN
jgi:hypothetical protein